MRMIDNLKNNYSSLFDFQDNFQLGSYSFDLYASYYQENIKYFGSKKLEIYSFTNNEHLFLKDLGDQEVSFEKLKDFFSYVHKNFIVVDDKHMSSVITVIYLVNKLTKESQKKIKKFSFYKSYLLGLKGFVNGKLIVIDKTTNLAYENKLAKGDAARLKLLA